MFEEDTQALLDVVRVLVELFKLVQEVLTMRNAIHLGTLDDALHRELEDEVQVVELFDLIGQLLVDVRPVKDAT